MDSLIFTHVFSTVLCQKLLEFFEIPFFVVNKFSLFDILFDSSKVMHLDSLLIDCFLYALWETWTGLSWFLWFRTRPGKSRSWSGLVCHLGEKSSFPLGSYAGYTLAGWLMAWFRCVESISYGRFQPRSLRWGDSP